MDLSEPGLASEARGHGFARLAAFVPAVNHDERIRRRGVCVEKAKKTFVPIVFVEENRAGNMADFVFIGGSRVDPENIAFEAMRHGKGDFPRLEASLGVGWRARVHPCCHHS